MKRSEMVLRVMEMLVELPEDLEAAAGELVDRMVKAGMNPPHRAILADNPNIKTSEDMTTMPALIVKDTQTWEPEECSIPEFAFQCNDCTCDETAEEQEARLIREGKRSGAV